MKLTMYVTAENETIVNFNWIFLEIDQLNLKREVVLRLFTWIP